MVNNSEPCIVCGAVESHTPWCTVPKDSYEAFSLSYAKETGQRVIDLIKPQIKRDNQLRLKVSWVGSIGREESQVGDIDILIAPEDQASIRKIKANLLKIGEWSRGADRMMVVDNVFGSGIKLDLFLCHPPAQWGVLEAVRLNPKEFVIWAKAKLDGMGYRREGGTIYDKHEQEIYVHDEKAYFRLLDVEWVQPNRRYELCKKLGIEISNDRT